MTRSISLPAVIVIAVVLSISPARAGDPPCEIAKIDPGGFAIEEAQFGFRTAISHNSDGDDYIIVGAIFEDHKLPDGTLLPEAGAAYLYSNDGSGWVFQQRLTSNSPRRFENFGTAVDISKDGVYAVVGANDKPSHDIGRVYVFKKGTSGWDLEQVISDSNAVGGGLFGGVVSINFAGDVLFVGAKYDGSSDPEDEYNYRRGKVYVYGRTGQGSSPWEQKPTLQAAEPLGYKYHKDNFGVDVDIVGNYAAIGARQAKTLDSEGDPTVKSGKVYIFHWNGTIWDQVFTLKALYPEAGDWFGFSVELGDYSDQQPDPWKLVIGAPKDSIPIGEEGGGMSYQGCIYMAARQLDESWTITDQKYPDDIRDDDEFGREVSITRDGTQILVGAPFKEAYLQGPGGLLYEIDDAGAAYLFTDSGSNGWTQLHKIQASDFATRDYYGFHLDMTYDGGQAVIGSKWDDYDDGGKTIHNVGSAYIVGLNQDSCP